MMTNTLPTEQSAIVGVIDPDVYAAGANSTGWVDAGDWTALMAVVCVGDMGSGGTLDAKLEQATSSGGAGVKDVTGKSITQLTQAGTDADKQAIINLRSEELDLAGGFRYVRLTVTGGDTNSPDSATVDYGAVLLGFWPRTATASSQDATTVDEIVA